MYDYWGWLCLIMRFCANSALAYSFAGAFLQPKLKIRTTFILSTLSLTVIQSAVYVPFGFFFNSLSDVIFYVLFYLAGLILTLKLFFKDTWGRVLFCAFCICSGRELIWSILHVFDYCFMLTLWNYAVGFLEENHPEYYAANQEMLFFWFDFADSLISLAVYIILYRLYLRLIERSFLNKTAAFSRYENILLILPFLSSICIFIAVKVMNQYHSITYAEFFVKVPREEYWNYMADYFISSFWMLIKDICLASANVAYIRIFQRLSDYNGEKEKNRMLANQVEQTEKDVKEIEGIYADIKGLRHDMKNHLESISLYIGRKYGEDKELTNYLGQMTDTVRRLEFSENTGNGITDIIIAQKTAEAAKKGIILTHNFSFPLKSAIDAYHIGIILNNALQNAIEACERESEKEIYLCSYLKGSLYFIKCQNSFTGHLNIDKNSGLPLTQKENKAIHGLGLSNIKRCAEKYMGGVDISDGEGKFTLTVMLHSQNLPA